MVAVQGLPIHTLRYLDPHYITLVAENAMNSLRITAPLLVSPNCKIAALRLTSGKIELHIYSICRPLARYEIRRLNRRLYRRQIGLFAPQNYDTGQVCNNIPFLCG